MRRPLHIAVPVWGPRYLENYLEFSILFHLGSGNLSDIRSGAESRYTIYTSNEEAEFVFNHPNVRKIAKLVNLEVISIQETSTLQAAPHYFNNLSFIHALTRAKEERAAVTFLSPDLVVSRGSLTFLERLWQEGCRCAMGGGPSTLASPFKATLGAAPQWPASRRPDQGVSSAFLCRAMLDNLHPWTDRQCLGRMPVEMLAGRPGVYLRGGANSLACVTFLLHPFLLDGSCMRDDFANYFDASFDLAIPFNTTLDAQDIYVLEDSEELCSVEFSELSRLTPLHDVGGPGGRIATLDEVAQSMASFYKTRLAGARPRADLAHHLVDHCLIYRTGPRSLEMDIAVADGRRVIDKVKELIEGL